MSNGWAGRRAVLALPSVYIVLLLKGQALRESALLRSLTYPQGPGLGQSKAQGLRPRKPLIFFHDVAKNWMSAEPFFSNFYCKGITKKIFGESNLSLKTILHKIKSSSFFFFQRRKMVKDFVLSHTFHKNSHIPNHSSKVLSLRNSNHLYSHTFYEFTLISI